MKNPTWTPVDNINKAEDGDQRVPYVEIDRANTALGFLVRAVSRDRFGVVTGCSLAYVPETTVAERFDKDVEIAVNLIDDVKNELGVEADREIIPEIQRIQRRLGIYERSIVPRPPPEAEDATSRYVALLEAEVASWMTDRGDEEWVGARVRELRRAAKEDDKPLAYLDILWRA